VLSRFSPLAQVANYALAYSLGGAVSIVILSPFMLAWPTAMFAIAKREDATQIFQQVFRWFSLVLLFAALAFSLACTIMLKLLFPPEYHSAAPIILIIATSLMFYGILSVFQIGISVRRKTWLATISTTISALANVGLNLALIPLYGSMGAAVSTLIAYILLALICYIINQRIYPIPFEIGRFGIGLVIGLAFYLASSFLARTQGIYGECAIYIGAIGFYTGCLVLLGKSSSWSHTSAKEQTQEVRIS
jgi:O-antigen/teichoic acid export membrane protein